MKKYKQRCPKCNEIRFVNDSTHYKIKSGFLSGKCIHCASTGNKYREGLSAWNKGIHKKTNTGRTHFKKGFTPWNKGIHTGIKPWLGKKRDLKTRKNISIAKKLSSKTIRGKNHHHWGGGTSKERNKILESFDYKQWRTAVFERDNYICQECKKTGIYLEADHIKPWCLYPKLRFEVGNGRTLCKKCHYLIGWNVFKENNPRKNYTDATLSTMSSVVKT